MPKDYKYYKAINWNQIEDNIDLATWEKLTEQFWLDTRIPLSNDLDDWRKLSDEEKDLVGKVFGGLTLLDTLQSESGLEALRKDIRTQKEAAIYSNIQFMECYTKGHKVLTYDGFKDISEIEKGDLVLSYNPETQKTQFEKVIQTSKHTPKNIYHFSHSSSFDLKVSPGHKMLIEEKIKKESKCNIWVQKEYTAEELYNKKFTSNYRIILNKDFKNDNHKLSSYDKFLIAYQADGSHATREIKKYDNLLNDDSYSEKVKSTNLYCKIGFKKERKISRFLDIIKDLDISFTELKETEKGRTWAFHLPFENFSKKKEFKDWFDLETFDSSKSKEFIQELSHWDGYSRDRNSNIDYITYYTNNKNNKDFVEQVATLAGYTFVTKKENKKNTDLYGYSVRIKRNNLTLSLASVKKEILSSEEVYGIEVPSHYLLIKTKYGNVISGNCVHAKSYSSIFSTLNTPKEIDEIFEWVNNNEILQKKAEIINNIYQNGTSIQKKVASVFLESFLFYSGFFTPLYYLGNNKLANVAEIIKLIIRDESVHGTYIGYKFQLAFNELSDKEQEELKDWVYNLCFELYENEIKYTELLYQKVGWVDEVSTFLRYNANKALMNLGFDPLFPDTANDVNPIVMNGISTGTSNHDFFSQVGNGYLLGQVESMKDSDYSI